jgi:hypothetical protein
VEQALSSVGCSAGAAARHAGNLAGLAKVVHQGVSSLEVVWLAKQDLMARHVQALLTAVGPYITHVTHSARCTITNRVRSAFWAASPCLRPLGVMSPPRSIAPSYVYVQISHIQWRYAWLLLAIPALQATWRQA